MANTKQKCPMCSTKLKMINGRMACKNCGYYLRNPNEQVSCGAPQYDVSPDSNVRPQNNISQRSGTTYRSAGAQPTPPQNKGKKSTAIAVVGICIAIFALIALVRVALFTEKQERDAMMRSLEAQLQQDLAASAAASASAQSSSSPSPSLEAAEEPEADIPLPQSELFAQMCESIWGKDCRDITAEEYASLTLLQLERNNNTIYYQIGDNEAQSLIYTGGFTMDTSDLACFPGLTIFSIDGMLSEGDLDGLENLYAVFTENSIEELLNIIPYPENILELGAESLDTSLDGLEDFPNLQYLSIHYGNLDDMSALKQFPDLRGLILKTNGLLTDFSPLMTLTNLEYLSIESGNLSTLDFLKVMPNLTQLIIKNSNIRNLKALTNCQNLTALTLEQNYRLESFAEIGELEHLTSLTLELSATPADSPLSLTKLTKLQEVTLKYADDLSLLEDAVNVTCLSLENCNGQNLEALTSMRELDTLIISGLSSYYIESLEPLTRIPKLTVLDLTDTAVYANVEELFGIPTLQYLGLSDCRAGIDFDKLPVNNTLEMLNLNSLAILDEPEEDYWGWGWDTKSLTEHYDMFSHFPNLTELHLADLELEDIEFVEHLPRLEYLDISNNYVTSLKPLEDLENFHAVWCADNPILESVSEDSNIIVISSK